MMSLISADWLVYILGIMFPSFILFCVASYIDDDELNMGHVGTGLTVSCIPLVNIVCLIGTCVYISYSMCQTTFNSKIVLFKKKRK